jgi:hypothetical protein
MVDRVRENQQCRGVGHVDEELVRLAISSSDHERAPREVDRRRGAGRGVGEDGCLVGLIETNIVEVERAGVLKTI